MEEAEQVVTINTIKKSSDSIIERIERQLAQNSDVYIDKSINNKIDKIISTLGKEKLIADHINDLANNYNKDSKTKALFLLVKLYRLNKQAHESLLGELKNDRKLLDKRVNISISKNNAQKDIFRKLLAIADKHYKFVKNYAKNFDPRMKYPASAILSVVAHKRKAETIYKALANIRARKTLHRVLVQKLDTVFQSLINSTADLSNKLAVLAGDISKNKIRNLKDHAQVIDSIISAKLDILRDFAYKYSYNVIHSDHFFDLDGNKIILVTRNDHRHAAV